MKRAWLVTLVLAIANCGHVQPHAERAGPLLDPLLPPESLGHALALSQVVTGEYGEQSHSIRMEIEATPERLVMVGLSHVGIPLFSLEQKAGDPAVRVKSAGRLPFDPEHMLADVQLVYWPATVLMTALAGEGLRLEDRPSEGLRRVLDQDGRLLVEIRYPEAGADAGETIVRHFDHPYRLRIKTLAAKA